jgi:hypothetical protein
MCVPGACLDRRRSAPLSHCRAARGQGTQSAPLAMTPAARRARARREEACAFVVLGRRHVTTLRVTAACALRVDGRRKSQTSVSARALARLQLQHGWWPLSRCRRAASSAARAAGGERRARRRGGRCARRQRVLWRGRVEPAVALVVLGRRRPRRRGVHTLAAARGVRRARLRRGHRSRAMDSGAGGGNERGAQQAALGALRVGLRAVRGYRDQGPCVGVHDECCAVRCAKRGVLRRARGLRG